MSRNIFNHKMKKTISHSVCSRLFNKADPEVTDYVLNEMIVSPREPTKDTGHIEFTQKPLPEIYEDEICPTCKSKLIITEGL